MSSKSSKTESKIVKCNEIIDQAALNCVKFALKLHQMNKIDQAHKLFKHALMISPNHHDVLLHYGEFLEAGNDIMNADYFYLKAVSARPQDSKALAHRKRTLPVVNQLDNEELKKIELQRAELIKLENADPTLKQFKEKLYYQYIYHTLAIDGCTMNLAEIRKVVDTKLVVFGKSIMEHNEILGFDSALHFLNQTLMSQTGDIRVSDILELHKRVVGYEDSINAGTFRKTEIFVGEYIPPMASDVERLMDEFVSELGSSTVKNMHPVYVAAFAHHKLEFIHPFLYGNGKTSRLLMNLIFLKYGYPLIIIRKEERSQYFKTLHIARIEDHRPFYRFIARSAKNTIDVFLQAYKV